MSTRSVLVASLALAITAVLCTATSLAAQTPQSATATAAPAKIDVVGLRTALNRAVHKAGDAGFSGVVLVAEHGKILFEAAIGQADRSRNLANTLDTRFNLASTGKLFTTVAVLQLVEQGKLALDAPLGRYLPDWPQPQVREATVRQLLTHTSGLGSYFGLPEFENGREQLRSVADHLPMIATQVPAFAPGSDWAYSNAGFMLLGRLVEIASGEDYYDYIRRHVFAPAGMRDSGYYDMEGKAAGVALGYLASSGFEDNTSRREWRGGPAGGGYATARDLLKFQQALAHHKLLRAETRKQLLTPIALPGEGGRRNHGLGPIVMPVGNDIAYAHPGGGPGMAAQFWATRDRETVVVVLGNTAGRPGPGQGSPTMALSFAVFDAVAAAGGPRLGGAMRPRS